MRGHIVGGLVVMALGGGLLGLAFASGGSVRDYIKDKYRSQGKEGSALVYRSGKAPTRTADDIAGARNPADRRASESGVFLRYQRDYVGIVPDGRGGSRILVEDHRSGYRHFNNYVGGFWGTFSGRGESFRGGGPGAGK